VKRLACLAVGVVLVLPLVATSCSFGHSFCSESTSVATAVSQINAGLTNIDQSSASQFGAELQAVVNVLNAVRHSSNPAENVASTLFTRFSGLVSALNSVSWDFASASESQKVSDAVDSLTGQEWLQKANSVDAYVITRCGMPSTVAISRDSVDTLPPPSIPSPDVTDPPMNTLSPNSDAEATGQMVGNLFGLTLSSSQVLCLGTALQGVADQSGFGGGVSRYQKQFQTAFDYCHIPFTVPES